MAELELRSLLLQGSKKLTNGARSNHPIVVLENKRRHPESRQVVNNPIYLMLADSFHHFWNRPPNRSSKYPQFGQPRKLRHVSNLPTLRILQGEQSGKRRLRGWCWFVVI